MDISVRANRETKKVLLGIKNLPAATRRGIQLGFQEMGANLVRTAENSVLNESKLGRWYPNNIKRLHRASAKGQTPALITGQYFEGLDYVPRGGMEIEFGNEAPHAVYLENGTSNMEPRPGLRNSIDSNARNFRQYIETSLEKELMR